MKIQVLLDYENVQPAGDEFVECARTDMRLAIFHGSHQTRFDADMVKALQPLGARVDYVQCSRHGKNALDFVIAYHLGRLSTNLSSGSADASQQLRYVIVSKDGDFDSLIEYANASGLVVSRVGSLAEALGGTAKAPAAKGRKSPAPKPTAAVAASPAKTPKAKPAAAKASASANDVYKKIVENLRAHPTNRPSTRPKLEKHLGTMIGKATTLTSAQAVAKLQRDGHLALSANKVTYRF